MDDRENREWDGLDWFAMAIGVCIIVLSASIAIYTVVYTATQIMKLIQSGG